ncbi:MAG: hypothetical protein A2W80_16525 [Candidatus Riflebacteria bacterium GWC2_50_8]|nr:MAG: hypothetical protein A2W80_16525 [Candidatus Riflebacteria bacterium GWC2_50_8]
MNGIESPAWAKYAGDLFFLILFLVFFFFFKPNTRPADEWDEGADDSEEEQPNPLEQILVSEDTLDAHPSDPETDLEFSSKNEKQGKG